MSTPTNPERLAARFHEAYERLAPSFGYETREASAKPWADVPENNRALMTAVCAEVLTPLLAAPDRDWDTAVEWLINSRHLDSDARDAFWMLSQGFCTEDEADRGGMDDGRTITEARALHNPGGGR